MKSKLQRNLLEFVFMNLFMNSEKILCEKIHDYSCIFKIKHTLNMKNMMNMGLAEMILKKKLQIHSVEVLASPAGWHSISGVKRFIFHFVFLSLWFCNRTTAI